MNDAIRWMASPKPLPRDFGAYMSLQFIIIANISRARQMVK